MLTPRYIVVHTAAFNGRNCDVNVIDRWHKDRGWNGVGYHFIIVNDKHDTLEDGLVQPGRDIHKSGAHTKGLNKKSIGICCVGHGDHESFTSAQQSSLLRLISRLIDEHEHIKVNHVIGHREINHLINDGEIASEYRTSKTCPGSKVDMDIIRQELKAYRARLSQPAPMINDQQIVSRGQLHDALSILEHSGSVFPNAGQSIREVLTHPEIIEFRTGLPDDGADDHALMFPTFSRADDGGDERPPTNGGDGRPRTGGGTQRQD